MRNRLVPLRPFAWWLLFLAVVAAAPFLDDYYRYLTALVLIYWIFATGYNLIFGYAGQFDFAQAAFLALGAYTYTILAGQGGWHPWPALAAGCLISAAVGVLVGFAALRLAGFYLAMMTVAFNEALILAITHFKGLTHGHDGLSVPPLGLGPWSPASSLARLWATALLATAVLWFTANLVSSGVGQALVALRGSETAAAGIGLNVRSLKLRAYGLSAAYGGLAGGLFASLITYITPVNFGLLETVKLLTMLVVGGMGSLVGPLLGAAVIIAIPELMRFTQGYLEVTYGLLTLLCVLFMPRGLYGAVAARFRQRPLRSQGG